MELFSAGHEPIVSEYPYQPSSSAYDFEEYVKSHIDDGVEFDSEYSQFFAYTHTPETAIEFVKKIEDWFDKIRK